MSHYKPYPAYEDSGVEWLGMVPEHWDTQRIRSLIDSAQNGIWGDDPDGGADDIACARVADFDRNSFTVKGELPTLRKVPEAQRLSRQVNPGDLLIEKSGGGEQTTVGVVVQYQGGQPVICSNFVAVVKPKKGVFPRWLCYTNAHLYSVGVNVRSIKQTTGIQNIDSDQYFSERVAVPPESERQAISAHLDRETSRIDALIEKKTRFIELLREKRQALITHAVTKGLDPSVKMKDSGVEWLGEVPEHWDVLKVGRHATVITGFAFSSDGFSQDESKVRLLRGINIGVSRLRWDETVYWERKPGDRLEAFELSAGTIVLGMDRPWISEGLRIAIVRPEDLPCLLLQRVASITTDSFLNKEYLYLLLSSDLFKAGLLPDMTGLSVPHISAEQITGFRFALPPAEEQKSICEHVYQELERIDQLAQRTEHSIDLLKERRSALITAAVTGQIDLREAV